MSKTKRTYKLLFLVKTFVKSVPNVTASYEFEYTTHNHRLTNAEIEKATRQLKKKLMEKYNLKESDVVVSFICCISCKKNK